MNEAVTGTLPGLNEYETYMRMQYVHISISRRARQPAQGQREGDCRRGQRARGLWEGQRVAADQHATRARHGLRPRHVSASTIWGEGGGRHHAHAEATRNKTKTNVCRTSSDCGGGRVWRTA